MNDDGGSLHPEGDDEVKDGVEGLIDRHGDAAAEELVKTIRTTRRITAVMFVVVGVVFAAVAGLIVWATVDDGVQVP